MAGPIRDRLQDIYGDIRPRLGIDEDHYRDEEVVQGYEEDRRGTRGGQYIKAKEDAWTRRFFDRLDHDMDDLSGVSILDVGGGPGTVTRLLADKGADVDYLDASPQMASYAQAAGEASGNTAGTYTVGDATRLPFDDDSYDVVVSRRTAHVIPADRFSDYVAEMGRVAEDGALFDTFRTPSARDLYNWALPMPSTLRSDDHVEAVVDDTPGVDIIDVDHEFAVPYGVFRRADDPDTVETWIDRNERWTDALPSLASVSVYHLDTRHG